MSKARIAIIIAALFSFGAIAHADPASSKITIAVLPFNVIAPAGNEWLGRAMQEGLATNLQKSSDLSATIIAGLPPADANAAIAQAKTSSGAYVLFGSIQLQDDQMRVTAQILSLVSNQSIGSLKSDGSQRDLFNIEDLLADHAQRLLLPIHTKTTARTASPAPTLELVGPTISDTTSRYYDGNLMSQINPPADPYRDDYDRYYYQSYDTSAFGYYYGFWGCGFPFYAWGWGGWGGFGGGLGHMVYPVAAPVSGW